LTGKLFKQCLFSRKNNANSLKQIIHLADIAIDYADNQNQSVLVFACFTWNQAIKTRMDFVQGLLG